MQKSGAGRCAEYKGPTQGSILMIHKTFCTIEYMGVMYSPKRQAVARRAYSTFFASGTHVAGGTQCKCDKSAKVRDGRWGMLY